jgi:serine/threonine-protein kinase
VGEFLLDRFEVRSSQFVAWLGENPSRLVVVVAPERGVPCVAFQGGEPLVAVSTAEHPDPDAQVALRGGKFVARNADRPIASVSWRGASEYCKARGKRLPTEIEWEYAARGVARREQPWGDKKPACAEVAFGRLPPGECAHGVRETAPVGSSSLDRTPEGIADLAGNVSEWTADAYPVEKEDGSSCLVKGKSACRVVRGGGFSDLPVLLRSALRSRLLESEAAPNVGFRCAKDAQ